MPSTVTKPEPVGFEVIVIEMMDAVKLAVMVPGPLRVAEVDVEDKLSIVIDPVLLQVEKI